MASRLPRFDVAEMLGFQNNRRWVYSQSQSGRYRTRHRLVGLLLQLNLVLLPWIRVSGEPAIRIDVDGRRLYAFGQIFTPTEGPLLMVFALGAVFSLFLFTSQYGRLWCGFACPQTVFLEEWARPFERLIEGDRNARIKLDAEPPSWRKFRIKATKLAVYAVVAVGIAGSFQAWFAGAPELWTGRAGPVDYALVAFFSTAWFADFAWFREQFCNYLCPYARFQGALTDDHSLTVHYAAHRGEPRSKGKASGEAGHCVECQKCVVVCPQGIDIRNGFQLECISCGRCLDACDSVMERFGHPGLIEWNTPRELRGEKKRTIRPRTAVYGALLSVLAVAFVGLIGAHSPMELTVQRAPGTLFIVDPDGWLRSTYLVRVTNRATDPAPAQYAIEVEGLDGAEVSVPTLALGSDETATVPLIVRLPPDRAGKVLPFEVRATSAGRHVERPATFNAGG